MKKNNFFRIFFICFLGLMVAVSATFFGKHFNLHSNNVESNLNRLAFEQGISELNTLENIEGLTENCSTVSDLQEIISKDVFSSERGDEKIEDLSFEIVQKELKKNEYNIFQGENGYEIYPEFSLKTLIVDDELDHDYLAEIVVSGYKQYKVLSFDSIDETRVAFETLTSEGKNVWENQIISTCAYSDESYDYSTYKTWGASSMDVGGINSYINSNCSSNEVVVVVLDSGINTSHELFKDRLLTDSEGKYVGSSHYTTSYSYSGYTFEDDNSHGTHVSGIIADLTPDNVKILPIKIMNSAGKGTSDKILSALSQVETYSSTYSICAVNMSFGGQASGTSPYTNSFASLRAKNILPIVAAGNESVDTANCDPAKCDNAIVVSSLKKTSTNECLFDAEYSNYGDEVDISAPGTAITSAGISKSNSASATSYVTKSGTSMATPHVSAGVALLAVANSGSTASEIESKLYNLAVDMGAHGKDNYYGNGVLNLRFFNEEFSSESITLNDGTSDISNIETYEFDVAKNLTFLTNDSDYEVYYSINAIPTSSNESKIESQYLANSSNRLYYYAIKISNGEIVARTKIFSIIMQFNSTNPEDYFTINDAGMITAYTGQFSTLTIPDTIKNIEVKSIGKDVFQYSELVSLTLPSSCKIISEYAFYDCFKLKYLNAPGVTTALKGAFYGCTALTKVSSESPGSSTEGFYLPNLSMIGKNAFTLCNNLKTVSLSSATVIGEDAFYYCPSLNNCYLPNVVTLMPYSFYGCSNITSFYIGEKLATLDGAFALSGLQSITFSDSNNNFYYDGKGLYSEGELKLVALSDYDSYEIKNSYQTDSGEVNVTSICEYAFPREGTILKKLVLPENLQTADGNIFDGYINYLYIKSTNLNTSGYYIDSTYTEPIVAEVLVLEFGENVSSIPNSFMDAFKIEYLVINSKSTELCASITPKNFKLTGLYLNFSQAVDGEYLQTLRYKGVMSTEHIYTKAQLPSNYTDYYSSLSFIEKNGDFYVYSKNSTEFVITIDIEGEGSVYPASLFYVSSGGDLHLFFDTAENYNFAGIYVGTSNLIPEDEFETLEKAGEVKITGITSSATLKFVFYQDNSYSYTVNYWKESLSGGTLVDGLYYEFDHSLTLRAVAGEMVTVTPNYSMGLGFTALDGQTFEMPSNNSKVINFYYSRNYYNLTLKHETGIDSVSGAGTYKFGQSINISAIVSEDYVFENWSADTLLFTPPTSQNATITMPYYNVELTANARINVSYITFEEYSGGTISPAPTSNVYKAILGSNLTFTFTPDENYKIEDVIIDNVNMGSINQYTFTSLSQNHTVKVVFVYCQTYSYSVQHWKESLTETEKVIGGLYYELETTENLFGKENDYTIAMAKIYEGFKSISFPQRKLVSEGIIINIYYKREVYDLTLLSGSGILRVEGSGSYKFGEQVDIKAHLINGYKWTCWSSINPTYNNLNNILTTITMPACDLTLSANADKIEYNIYFEPYENGTISPFPAGLKFSVYYLANIQFEFSPNSGYVIKDVVIDGESKGAISSWSFREIDSDHTVNVQFERGVCSVVIKSSEHGSVTADKSLENITSGEIRTFTITPKEGFLVKKVLVDGKEVSVSNNKFSLTVYTQNINIEVIYTKIPGYDDNSTKNEEREEKKTITIAGHEFSIIEIVAYTGSAVLILILLILTIVVSKKSKSDGRKNRDTFE